MKTEMMQTERMQMNKSTLRIQPKKTQTKKQKSHRLLMILSVFAFVVGMLAGCGKKDTKPDSYEYSDLGITFELEENWKKNKADVYVSPVYGQSYSPISGLIVNYKDHDYPDVIKSLFTIAFADMEQVKLDTIEEMIGGPDRIADVQEMTTAGKNTYYFCTFPEDTEGLSESQKERYLSLWNSLDIAKENIQITEATYSSEDPQITGTLTIPEGTTDLDGNEVDTDIFSENKLTMINIWGSFCNPCIEEMPMLQKFNDEYKDKGFAIVGILGDAAGENGTMDTDTAELGKTILTKNNVTYQNIAMNIEIQKMIATSCFPTSIFVDGTGTIVGETIYGAQTEEEYRKTIEDLLAQVTK